MCYKFINVWDVILLWFHSILHLLSIPITAAFFFSFLLTFSVVSEASGVLTWSFTLNSAQLRSCSRMSLNALMSLKQCQLSCASIAPSFLLFSFSCFAFFRSFWKRLTSFRMNANTGNCKITNYILPLPPHSTKNTNTFQYFYGIRGIFTSC